MDWFLARYSLQLLELRPSWPGAQLPPDDKGVTGSRTGSLIRKSTFDMGSSSMQCQRLPDKSMYQQRRTILPWAASHLPATSEGTSSSGDTHWAHKRDRSQVSAAGHSLSLENTQLVAYSWICHHLCLPALMFAFQKLYGLNSCCGDRCKDPGWACSKCRPPCFMCYLYLYVVAPLKCRHRSWENSYWPSCICSLPLLLCACPTQAGSHLEALLRPILYMSNHGSSNSFQGTQML